MKRIRKLFVGSILLLGCHEDMILFAVEDAGKETGSIVDSDMDSEAGDARDSNHRQASV